MSPPWHGPYRVVERRDPDIPVTKVYHPQEGNNQVHQKRVHPNYLPDIFGMVLVVMPLVDPRNGFKQKGTVGVPGEEPAESLGDSEESAESLGDPGEEPTESHGDPDDESAESLGDPGEEPVESYGDPDDESAESFGDLNLLNTQKSLLNPLVIRVKSLLNPMVARRQVC